MFVLRTVRTLPRASATARHAAAAAAPRVAGVGRPDAPRPGVETPRDITTAVCTRWAAWTQARAVFSAAAHARPRGAGMGCPDVPRPGVGTPRDIATAVCTRWTAWTQARAFSAARAGAETPGPEGRGGAGGGGGGGLGGGGGGEGGAKRQGVSLVEESYVSIDDHSDDEDEVRVPDEVMENYDDRDAPKSLDMAENPELDTNHVQNADAGWKKHLPLIAAWTPRVLGGGVLVFAFTKASLYITTNLMGITLTDAVWFGFGAGFLSSSAIAVTAFGIYNTFDSVRPEPVYKAALEKIRADEEITRVLGPISMLTGGVNSGFMRSYKVDGGDIGFGPGHRGFSVPTFMGPENKLVWRYPRIQMMFQVFGRDRQALCTVEAFNRSGKTKLNLVALDVLNSDDPAHADPILVHGSPERLYIRDQLTGFIRFKKNYVEGSVQRYPRRKRASE